MACCGVLRHAIVAEIEAEQTLVGANRELIRRFEQKIQATLARILGAKLTKFAEFDPCSCV